MWEFLTQLLDTSGFPARWSCGQWTSGHGWLHILSDVAIFGAYVSIPVSIGLFVRRKQELVFPRLWWLFACFIFACGLTHLIEATLFWHPWYRLSGLVKLITALVSWTTVFAVWRYLPRAIDLPAMAALNRQLSDEVEDRKKAQAESARLNGELNHRVQELETMLAVIPVGIGIGNDRECRSIRSNDLLARMLRISTQANASLSAQAGVAPVHFKVHSHGRVLEAEELPMQRAARTGTPIRDFEEEVVFTDGQRVDLLVSAAPMMDGAGGVRGVIGAFVDVTALRAAEDERRRMEARLHQSQRLESLGVLAGGIAHDFNNLLTGVLGYASLIRWELPPASPLTPMVASIEEAAQRAAELCKRMLAFAGRDQFRLVDVVLDDFLIEAGRLPVSGSSSVVRVVTKLSAEGAVVWVDVQQMQQVLSNLLVNAAEALGVDGGTVLIQSGRSEAGEIDSAGMALVPEKPEGSYVYFEVIDEGCGMPTELMKRIFEPFFTTKFTGRGLGLASVLGIVKSHDGAIKVNSSEGKGTSVRVYLPVSDSKVPVLRSNEEKAPQPSNPRTILVIDDDDVLVKVSKRMLERFGFRALCASNGAEGLEQFRAMRSQVDGVLLDLTMPTMNGEEVFRRLREVDPSVPVVIMTGYDATYAMKRFGPGEASGFLAKPFTAEELRRVVVGMSGSAGDVATTGTAKDGNATG